MFSVSIPLEFQESTSGQAQSGSAANEWKTVLKVWLPIHFSPPSKASFPDSLQKRSWNRAGSSPVLWTTTGRDLEMVSSPLLLCYKWPSEQLSEIHMHLGSPKDTVSVVNSASSFQWKWLAWSLNHQISWNLRNDAVYLFWPWCLYSLNQGLSTHQAPSWIHVYP